MSLLENPHLAGLLAAKGLQVDPKQRMGAPLDWNGSITIGAVRPEGTVVGFCQTGTPGKLTCVVYDESKEGQDEALTTFECNYNEISGC